MMNRTPVWGSGSLSRWFILGLSADYQPLGFLYCTLQHMRKMKALDIHAFQGNSPPTANYGQQQQWMRRKQSAKLAVRKPKQKNTMDVRIFMMLLLKCASVTPIGDLGNEMFNYFNLRHIALRHNSIPCLNEVRIKLIIDMLMPHLFRILLLF